MDSFPPDVRLSAAWDVSLDTGLLAIRAAKSSPPRHRVLLGAPAGALGLGPCPAWAELAACEASGEQLG